MAPKRKAKSPAPPTAVSQIKTRSATAGKRAAPLPAALARAPAKKAKLASDANGKKSGGPKGKARNLKTQDKVSDAGEEPDSVGSSKTIIIEACKQCTSFKTRAEKVKEDLESAVSGIVVTINPDQPRKGCFEIREESGQIFISLLNMPRPFKPMKELDMDEVIEDIVKKIT